MGCGGSGILTVCGPLGLSERFRLLNLQSFVFRKKEAGGMLLVNLEWYFSLINFVSVDEVAYGIKLTALQILGSGNVWESTNGRMSRHYMGVYTVVP